MSKSKFLGVDANLSPNEEAALTVGASLAKGLLGACLTGSVAPLANTVAVAEDLAEQAIQHPQQYNRPPKI